MKKLDITPADDFRGAGGGGGGGSTPHRTPDNIRMQDWMECVLGLGYGPIKGLAPGVNNKLENFIVGDTPLFNVGTNQANFPNFRIKIYAGLDTDPAINFTLGGAASNQTVNVQLLHNVPVVRSTSVLQRGHIDRLEVRLVFQRLLRATKGQDTYNGTAEFRIEYKPSNSSVWSLYAGESVSTMTGKTSANSPKDFIIPVPRLYDDDWDVRVTKLTPENNTEIGTFADMVFESIQMVETAPKKYDDIAVVHLIGRATNQFASVPDFYGIYDGLIVDVPSNYDPVAKTYDERTPWNGLWKKSWTDNPAFLLRELIKNPLFGMAAYYLHVSVVDAEFYNAGKWCDTLVPVGNTGRMRPRFTMNMVVTEAMQGMEFLRYIAGAFNSTIFDDGNGNISLRTDAPRAPSYIFTPENVSEEGFSYSYTDVTQRHNDITVVFGNKALDYNEDRRKATIDNTDVVAQNGLVPYEFVAIGCDNVDEAVARANYRYMIANTEVTTVSFQATRLGMLLDVFDTVYVADPRSGWSTGGRVKSIANGLLHLRDPIYFETQAQVTLRVQTFEGLRTIQAIPTVMGVNYSLQLANPASLPAGDYPERTTFTVEDTVNHGLAKPFRIISIEESESGLNSYAITAIEVNVNKYHDADLGVESEQIDYSYKTPGEPVLPPELVLETGTAHIIVNNDGTLINRIYANWERPLNAFTAYYELDYKRMDDSTWTTVKAMENDAYLGPVQDDMLYHIRLFAITPTGRRGREYLERTNFRVSGKSLGLDVPTGVVVEKGQTGWRFGWDQPANGDYDGMEIRQGGVNSNWDTARVIARRLKDNAFQYQWLGEGVTRFFFKYKDTSGNESNQAVALDVEVFAPPVPVVRAETRNGLLNLLWGEVEGTQPTDVYQFRWGTADTTPTDATPVGQIRGSSFTTALNDPTIRRGHLRAVDAGGNVSGWTSFEVGMEDTVDPTPPPTVTGLTATAALNSITIVTDVASYKVGHGHRNTRLYAAEITEANPDPQFNENLFVGTFQGSVETFPATIRTRWRFWAKWTTNDGYDSELPSAPAEAETGSIGDKQLADDLDLAGKLAEGSITGDKLAAGAIDSTKFAQGLEPVTIVPDGEPLPTEKGTSSIVWEGQTYIWDAATSKYIKPAAGTVSAEDIEGLIEAGQLKDGIITADKIAPGAIDNTKFAEGIEPITIVTTPALPTVKSTSTIMWQGALYRWDGTKYTKSVGAGDIAGQITNEQIASLEAAKLAGQITGTQITDGAISTGKIAAGAVVAGSIAAGAIVASKLTLTDSTNIYPDFDFLDEAMYSPNNAGNFIFAQTAGPNFGKRVIEIAASDATQTVRLYYSIGGFQVEPNTAYHLSVMMPGTGETTTRVYTREATVNDQGQTVWGSDVQRINRTASFGVTADLSTAEFVTGPDTRRMSLVFRRDAGGVLPAQFGGVRLRRKNGAELIVDGAITAGKIAANAITADNIQANAITAGKIAAAAINAREIAAGAITASKLRISAQGDALNPDSLFTDQDVWSDASGFSGSGTGGKLPIITQVADAYQGNSVLAATGYTWPIYDGKRFPIDPKKQYLLEIAARTTGTYRLYGVWRFFDASGAPLPGRGDLGWPAANAGSNYFYAPSNVALSAAWTRFSYPVGAGQAIRIPENACFMSASFAANYNAPAGDTSVTEIGLLRVSEMVAGELIVDGAITASKVAIGDFSNLAPDSMMVDPATWTRFGEWTMVPSAYPEFGSVNMMRHGYVAGNTGFGGTMRTGVFSVEPGKAYYFEHKMVAGGGASYVVQANVVWQTADGTDISAPILHNAAATSGTTVVTRGGQLIAPANAARCQMRISVNQSATSNNIYVGGIVVRRANSGELIVDGAITASKIMAEAITGDKIAANSITASRLVITDTSNTYPDYDFFDEAAYTGDGATQYWTWPGTSSNIFGRRALSIPANAAARSVYAYRQTNGIQVTPGAEFYLEAAFYSQDAAVSVGVQYGTVVANGTVTWGATIPVLTKPAGSSSTRPGASITMPAAVRRIAIVFTREGGGSAVALFGGVMLRRKSTGVLIADNAITAEKITADAITAGKIAAGAVNAREIAAGAVTADKMTIGGARDIVTVDPMFTSPEGWNAPAAWVGAPPTVANSATAYQGGRILQVGAGNNWAVYHDRKVPIDRNKQYVFETAVARAAAANGTYFGIVTFYDQTGTLIDLTAAGVAASYPQVNGGFGYVVAAATVGTGWTVFRAPFGVGAGPQIPSTAAFMGIGFITGNGATSTTGNWSVGMLQVREMVSGELIVAGAITANKLAANAIAVGTAAIQDAAITNAMIANLSADKITTGFLAAARIQAGTIATGHLAANSVTADKILAGSIDATKIAARSITADRIQAYSIGITEMVANNAFIADASISWAKIGLAQIWTAHIADAQISTAKIGVAQVDTLRIAGSAVVTANVAEVDTTVGKTSGQEYGTVTCYLPQGGYVMLFIDVKIDAMTSVNDGGGGGRCWVRTNHFGEVWQMAYGAAEPIAVNASTSMFRGFWIAPYLGAGQLFIADIVFTRPNNNYRRMWGRFAAFGMQR